MQNYKKAGLTITQEVTDKTFFPSNSSSKPFYSQSPHYSSQKNLFYDAHSSQQPSQNFHKNKAQVSTLKRHHSTPQSEDSKLKIMNMMREQIQISINFYSKEMKELLKQQSKQIIKLRGQLEENQKELIHKTDLIEKLKQNKIQSPKKKISLTAMTQQRNSPEIKSYNQVITRICNVEEKLQRLSMQIHQKNQNQKEIEVKIENIDQQLVKYFSVKISECEKKLQTFMKTKSQNIEKMEEKIKKLPLPEGQKNPVNKSMEVGLIKLTKQLGDLKGELQTFTSRQFKYENHQVEKIKDMISVIKTKMGQKYENCNKSPKVVSITIDKSNKKKQKQQICAQFESQQKIGIHHESSTKRLSQTQNLNRSHLKATQITRNQSNFDCSGISLRKQRIKYPHQNQQHIPENKSDLLEGRKLYQNYQNVDSCYSGEESQENSQNFSDEEDQIQNRLVEVLIEKGYKMPVLVEIDQTGYLKSVKDGMYIVDQDQNGFSLSQEDVDSLVEQRIIKLY